MFDHCKYWKPHSSWQQSVTPHRGVCYHRIFNIGVTLNIFYYVNVEAPPMHPLFRSNIPTGRCPVEIVYHCISSTYGHGFWFGFHRFQFIVLRKDFSLIIHVIFSRLNYNCLGKFYSFNSCNRDGITFRYKCFLHSYNNEQFRFQFFAFISAWTNVFTD